VKLSAGLLALVGVALSLARRSTPGLARTRSRRTDPEHRCREDKKNNLCRHGHNVIHTGGGRDAVLARYGRSEIHCDAANTIVNLSQRSKKHYELFGCKKVTLKPVGTDEYPG
jgi:hypothetical protein